MQKRSDLSDVQKDMIIGFRAKGGSISETANFVNCSRAAVVKVYRTWQYGTIQNQRRGTCGAPRAIDSGGLARLPACPMASGPLKHKLIWAPRICVCERERKERFFFLEKFLRLF
ncbi:hypothetical protein AVEN_261054-1 [Araneus ventricosus]|uniref:Tc3 transposase DNA binding domain-containing protein n=1 Tax=Araneus ventricosus TaxID=182803 RepID=A0A4Y2G464_ARAVE|nr:hypothetical protein AVEN_261054-1 [Araneus ventricosus]